MPPVVSELTISAGERPQTYALDRAATGTGIFSFILYKHYWESNSDCFTSFKMTLRSVLYGKNSSSRNFLSKQVTRKVRRASGSSRTGHRRRHGAGSFVSIALLQPRISEKFSVRRPQEEVLLGRATLNDCLANFTSASVGTEVFCRLLLFSEPHGVLSF